MADAFEPNNDFVADPTEQTSQPPVYQDNFRGDMGNPRPPVSPPVPASGESQSNLPSGDPTPSYGVGSEIQRGLTGTEPNENHHDGPPPIPSPTHDGGPPLGVSDGGTPPSLPSSPPEMHDPSSRMPASVESHDHVSHSDAYPPAYTGGAAVTDVEHLKNGATLTTTATGARIEQAPGGNPYQVHPPEHAGLTTPAGDMVTPDGERHGDYIPHSDPVSTPSPQPLAAASSAEDPLRGSTHPETSPSHGPVLLDNPHGPVPSPSHGLNFGVADTEGPAHHPGRI